jgi:hypothetical protein
LVRQYLDTPPEPEILDFLRYGSRELLEKYGEVQATAFDTFPSFPQRYLEPLVQQPLPLDENPTVEIVPLDELARPRQYTEQNLLTRRFLPRERVRSRPAISAARRR